MDANKRLDDLLQHFLDQGIAGVALSVDYKGKNVYTGYKGLARKEDNKAIDEKTIYQVFSCSKLITATAVMQLVEKGLILLNDPLENYLPYFKDMTYKHYDGSGEVTIHRCTNSITIKDLLKMTSGIPYPGSGNPTTEEYDAKFEGFFGKVYSMTVQELAKEIASMPLQFNPGDHWHYGYGYDVCGALIEVVTGMTFGEYLKKNIFEPLGMNDTTFVYTKKMKEDMACVYARTPDGTWVNMGLDPMVTEDNGNKLESGGGGLLSTLHDLSRFSTMWAMGGKLGDARILGSATIDLMRKNHLEGQQMEDFKTLTEYSYPHYKGYGWGLAGRTLVCPQSAGSTSSVGEFGWCGATGPYVVADPDRELAITFMMQTMPVIGGLQDYVHPRVRNAVYSLLDEWK